MRSPAKATRHSQTFKLGAHIKVSVSVRETLAKRGLRGRTSLTLVASCASGGRSIKLGRAATAFETPPPMPELINTAAVEVPDSYTLNLEQ